MLGFWYKLIRTSREIIARNDRYTCVLSKFIYFVIEIIYIIIRISHRIAMSKMSKEAYA